MPLFAAVGVAYYAVMGVVLFRGLGRRDRPAAVAAIAVLVGNELWNVAFFQRRSPRNGFYGILIFAVAVLALRHLVRHDRASRHLVDAYVAWLAYDAWWTCRLWQLNSPERNGPS